MSFQFSMSFQRYQKHLEMVQSLRGLVPESLQEADAESVTVSFT